MIEIIKDGILGAGSLQPWQIIIIFFSVAYVSISADITGIFDWLAYKIVHGAKNSGFKLFILFYLFACALTIFTSNDIVILTLTPIIFYLGKHAKINILPLLFAEFFGANTASMFLYIGNPTNIIIGNALNLDFLEYTRTMYLPTIVAAASNFILLWIVFRKKITKKFTINKSSHFSIRNWFDAILSSGLILLMLICLMLSQKMGLEIWQVTLFFAVIFILEDIIFGIYYYFKDQGLSEIQKHKSEFKMAFLRMPWKILPFIIIAFIFVQGLNHYGIISEVAEYISNMSTSLFSGIFINGFFALILANIINNQPMTIFFANIFINNNYIVNDLIFRGNAYAVVIASNLGANITLIGALAGLMWKKILQTKGLKINYFDFLKKGIIITPLTFVITLLTLFLILQ